MKLGWLIFIVVGGQTLILSPKHHGSFHRRLRGRELPEEAAIAAHQWFVDAFSPARTVCLIAKNNPASVRVAEVVGYRIYEECIYKGADCLKLVCQWENPQPAILSE